MYTYKHTFKLIHIHTPAPHSCMCACAQTRFVPLSVLRYAWCICLAVYHWIEKEKGNLNDKATLGFLTIFKSCNITLLWVTQTLLTLALGKQSTAYMLMAALLHKTAKNSRLKLCLSPYSGFTFYIYILSHL